MAGLRVLGERPQRDGYPGVLAGGADARAFVPISVSKLSIRGPVSLRRFLRRRDPNRPLPPKVNRRWHAAIH